MSVAVEQDYELEVNGTLAMTMARSLGDGGSNNEIALWMWIGLGYSPAESRAIQDTTQLRLSLDGRLIFEKSLGELVDQIPIPNHELN